MTIADLKFEPTLPQQAVIAIKTFQGKRLKSPFEQIQLWFQRESNAKLCNYMFRALAISIYNHWIVIDCIRKP